MINIGNKIILLRKKKGWSQTELSKIVGCSREIISKYEKENVMPSIEIAKKIADAFEVSLDQLVGEGQNAAFDKKDVERLQQIQDLPEGDKNIVRALMDAFLRDYKTRKAYAS